ncbi:MAG: amino acid permease, partial [Veillonella sp.]|nr:amino acid permease [Veillonella sp.]
PALAGDFYKHVLASLIVAILTGINLMGVSVSKVLSNVMTVAKLVPLILFIAIGAFFINGSNFTLVLSTESVETGSIASAALLLFFAYTGFEALAVAAEDMENPKKNLPKAIVVTMILVTFIYMAILAVCIGVMGPDLASTKTPIQDAFQEILGPVGMYIVFAGTFLSMLGINMAEAFYAPRISTALAQDGMVPAFFDKRNKHDVPYIAAIITCVLTILLTWTGSFTQLAAISAISRFTQMVPTILAVIIFRKRWPHKERSYKIPFGITIPVIAILITLWMISNATMTQIIWGLGGIVVIAPFYYFYWDKKRKGLIQETDDLD